jgi:dihydroorotate dehydrogenase
MANLYENVLRPLLFRMDPETAHDAGVQALRLLGHLPWLCRTVEKAVARSGHAAPVKAFGLEFPNQVGLAAGFDKDGLCWPAAAALGFGHVEIGTVTFQRQPGNPRPRLFRLPEERAVINRMGFNNAGAEAIAARLARKAGPGHRRIPVGINIGKSKAVNLEQAAGDYLATFRLVAPHADYVAINVSSPNTPDLRKLQEETRLNELLKTLAQENARLPRRLPLLVKIAPDLSFRQIDGVLETIQALGLDGIIATNTTLARPEGLLGLHRGEAGGLSGAPLRTASTQIIRYIHLRTEGRLPIIGVGGVDDSASAAEKLDAGATLVQIYTGWIYRGPFFAATLARQLRSRDWDRLLNGR